ncbi:hypothetical protein [Meiothermus hypogaeus]|uniref:Uncharacterized protein n=2 Tax=Meiothermus hypogaeus TaxID=884155 RepID=A0A511R0V6_9DEIN|nr:hypothetical protein [Meiothermus hypogaeus]RIH77354.1 hypothetical protein Mhypo_02063 [Meiothermus hypogaeus]GEM82917.1 hypothetical protein MHY01S_10830 [Meiothermus hypogaeus NBRC 106114]
MNATLNKVYVIRVWYEPSPGGEIWRASLSEGEERHYFAEPSALTAFLLQEMEESREEAPE